MRRSMELVDHTPFVDQLARRHLLKCNLDGGTYRDLVGWGPWKVGVKIDGRVLVQGDHRQIVGLIRHAPVEPAVLNDDIRGYVALPVDLFPRQFFGGPADLAGLLRWILELAAGGAVLQDQPLLIHRVPEG